MRILFYLFLIFLIFDFRYTKTIRYAVDHFQKHNLDAFLVMTNAPGRSAFNRVERRMAPLSHELSGVILPHDSYGSHLNASKKCINDELERRNFAKAGETLAEIWSNMTIDKHQAFAEYKHPGDGAELPEEFNHDWYMKHVRESQYFLQVI